MSVLENTVSDASPQRGEAGRGEKNAWDPTPVPPALLHAARDLRQHMTDAEQGLWPCLRGTQLDGFRLRKPHPIARFVLDCYCSAVQLAMEIDGAQHSTGQGAPAMRNARAASMRAVYGCCGFGIMRFGKISQAYSRGCGRPCTFPPPRLPPLGGGKMRWPHCSCR
jgi:very-short-patch-repair endonuclease